MIVCQENLHHAQKLQKQAYNKRVMSWSYAPGNKGWLNSKYMRTKYNHKLEVKFFGPFQVLHPIGKQAYMLKLLKKWKIYNIFHVSPLEQDSIRKRRVDKKVRLIQFDIGDNDSGKSKLEAICNSAVYARKSELGYLPSLYNLVL